MFQIGLTLWDETPKKTSQAPAIKLMETTVMLDVQERNAKSVETHNGSFWYDNISLWPTTLTLKITLHKCRHPHSWRLTLNTDSLNCRSCSR